MRRLFCTALALTAAGCNPAGLFPSDFSDLDVPVLDTRLGTGTVTATIDSVALPQSLEVRAWSRDHELTIQVGSADGPRITLFLRNVKDPVMVNAGADRVQIMEYWEGSGAWVTGLPGGNGTVNLTTRTAARAIGTFSFVGIAHPNTTATGSKSITNGTFDLTFQ